MNKVITFFLGFFAGIALMLGILIVRNLLSTDSKEVTANTEETAEQTRLPNGVHVLDEPIPYTESSKFKIFQVINENAALAHTVSNNDGILDIYYGYYDNPLVLIIVEQKNALYDDQIVSCPNNRKVMQLGTYKYRSGMGRRTVPVVQFIKQE